MWFSWFGRLKNNLNDYLKNKNEIDGKITKFKGKKRGWNIYFTIHINNKAGAFHLSWFITEKNTFPLLLVIG